MNASVRTAKAHLSKLLDRDEIERKLAVVWATVLDVEEVGVDDQFLELGGDSLAAMRVAALVMRVAGIEVPMSALLATATVGEMAAVVRATGARASK